MVIIDEEGRRRNACGEVIWECETTNRTRQPPEAMPSQMTAYRESKLGPSVAPPAAEPTPAATPAAPTTPSAEASSEDDDLRSLLRDVRNGTFVVEQGAETAQHAKSS